MDFIVMSLQNQSNKRKKWWNSLYILLYAIVLSGCVSNMKNLTDGFFPGQTEKICNENIEISNAKRNIAQLRSDIDYTEGAIEQSYYILQSCQTQSSRSARAEECLRYRTSIDIEAEKFKLNNMKVQESGEVDKLLSYSTQCTNYIANLPSGTSYDSYQLRNMRWMTPLNKMRVRVRRANLEQIANEFQIKLVVWEVRDKDTDTYMLKDVTKLEGRFFDDAGNMTEYAKTILTSILGKYALNLNTPSPPTLKVVIPFSFDTDAGKFFAEALAKEKINSIKGYLDNMLSIGRPIDYEIQKTEEDISTDIDSDVIFIHEIATKPRQVI